VATYSENWKCIDTRVATVSENKNSAATLVATAFGLQNTIATGVASGFGNPNLNGTIVSIYFDYQKGDMVIATAIFRMKQCGDADVGVSISLKNSIVAVAVVLPLI
jgi:hypothetical protein